MNKLKRINRKKRKLKYIRAKNGIRKGIYKVFEVVKVSDELVSSKVDLGIFIYEAYPDIVKRLKNYWRLNFMPIGWEIGRIDDDFLKQLHTIRYEFKTTKSYGKNKTARLK